MRSRERKEAPARSVFGRLLRRAKGRASDAPPAGGSATAAGSFALASSEEVIAEVANAPHAPINVDSVATSLLPSQARAAFSHHRYEPGDYDWRIGTGRSDGKRRTIAFLGSAELLRELAFDASVTVPDPKNWHETLVAGRFDYLLVETAWELVGDGWQYGLVSDGAGRPIVERLLAHCRRIALPVVVWFREDISNYPRFAWLAPLAERCYGISDALVQRLETDWPTVPVALLPMAIQPAIHNPLRSEAAARDTPVLPGKVLFDGWWDLLGGAQDNLLLRSLLDAQLVVVESEWEYSNVQAGDCPDYAGRAVGSLSPSGRLAVGKLCDAEIFLERSITLPWRNAQRMLRSAASGCIPLQLGEGSSLVKELQLPIRGDEEGLLAILRKELADPVKRAQKAHLLLRELLRSHCLAHRLQQIEYDLGIDLPGAAESRHPRVACVLVTRRPELLPLCLAWFRRERYPQKELIVVIHGEHPIPDLQSGADVRIRLFHMGSEHSLGECLNFAIAQSDAPYWAKIDDDDFYGDHYLHDLMSYRAIRDFDLIAKPPQFLYLENGDQLRWDQAWYEHSWLLHEANGPRAVQAAGGSLLGRRDLWERVRFSGRRRAGSDSEFIMRCYGEGHDLMVADGFNFVRFRSGQAGFHTWRVSDEVLRARSVALGDRSTLRGLALI